MLRFLALHHISYVITLTGNKEPVILGDLFLIFWKLFDDEM